MRSVNLSVSTRTFEERLDPKSMVKARLSVAKMIGIHCGWSAEAQASGALIRIRILSGALLLCLALLACSQEQPSSSALNRETSKETSVADSASPPAVQASGVSSGARSEPSVTKNIGRPPVVEKVSLEPRSPVTGDQLRATVQATDPAGETIMFLYRWTIDGQVVQESAESILNSPLHRGGFVELEVIASNHVSSCSPARVSAFVGNASPTVRFSGQSLGSDNNYQANIEATDPEGDPIKFLLRNGPPGIYVDPATGAIRWMVRPEDTGTSYEVQIAAQDSEGAETLLNYQIKTRLESGDGIVNKANDAAPSK